MTTAETVPADPRVLVLAGGLSHERDVSLRSGRRVAQLLRDAGLTVEVRDLDAELLPTLRENRPDVVLPLVHGSTGEDGSIRGLLELLDIPYVGSSSGPCRLASRKPVAKAIVAAAGVATPAFVTLPRGLFHEIGSAPVLSTVLAGLALPLVVKPEDGGSALGVTVVERAEDLPDAMVACFSYGNAALVERAVVGTEVAVSVVETADGPVALPPVEIVTDGPYDYDARYNAGRTEYFVPARLDAAATRAACDAAVAAHRALGLRDLSRTDLVVDAEGTPWFLDMNVAPGMTETSLYPQAAQAWAAQGGPSFTELLVELVRTAAARS
ncbi:D-alanine--D-alanine ligase [Georgenia satyanarayanai]|uniref:D-alanine--D-alanine ligase family protein n=1 Tax=Georgenia satyanarayanai TaxID=860221 RepID=UPI0020416F65|nr:D-alanine--D-alanine ligase [Georgenia satyanarayanai]MCM3661149.1 D-alanine--D-alanine ligase [Georgenia satyanarayanai]